MDSQKLRTYGKRSGIKRKQDSNLSASDRVTTSLDITNTTTSAKRRKVTPQTPTRDLSPTQTEVVSEIDPEEQAFLGLATAEVTYTSPRKPVKPNVKPSFSQPQFPAKGIKLAQDLSGILDAIAPASPSSPTKLAKRMLARSKTDSSIASQSSTREFATVDRTPSLPTIPSSSKTHEIVASTSKLAPLVLPLLPASSKPTTKTYAGQFRSFLVTLPAPNSQTINEEEEFDTRESYSSLRSRWDVDNSEDDPYPYTSPSPSKSKSNSATPDMSPFRSGKGKSRSTITAVRPPPIAYGMSNPLKSISELRNKGESRRFLDELGYLFEGMDRQGGLGLRRASALEITTKLCDPDFARKAKAADFFTRTWDLFLDTGAGKGEDKILDILLVFFTALVARNPTSLAELTQRLPSPPPSPSGPSKRTDMKKDKDLSFFDALFNILGSNSPYMDPLTLTAPNFSFTDADLKKGGIRAKDRTLLTTIYKTISSKSNLFPEGTNISTSLLIAFTLQTLPPSIIPSQHFSGFLSSLRLSLCPIASPSLASTLSLRWLDTAKAIPYLSIYYHLRLLDMYLLEQWNPHQEGPSQNSLIKDDVARLNDEEMLKAREDWLAEDLVAFAVSVELNKANEESDSFPAWKYLITTFRILVSLTHMDKLWARKVALGSYTMSLLMRTIHGSGQELQRGRGHLGGVDVKREEDEELFGAEEEAVPGKADFQALDTLCLALGLLTNLVQSVEGAKDAVREIQLNPSCSLKKRACGHQCTCSHRSNGIEILVQLYTQQQAKIESFSLSLTEDSPEARAEADASFLRGHLAVLFGLLMMGSAENESAILSSLPSSSGAKVKQATQAARRTKLARLVEQAKVFAAFYRAVSDDTGGEKESKVAGDVVHFLETRRDAAI